MLSRRRQWHATPVLLPRKSHGWRSLEGCSPWGRWGSDTTERLHFHFSLSCTREGNGNPLQCCCLENPRDGGAWWAAVYGVAHSWTRLKQLSSSSMLSRFRCIWLFMTPCCIPPGSSVHGLLQVRILEWVAMPSSRDLPGPGIEPASLMSPALAGGFFTTSAIWEALFICKMG